MKKAFPLICLCLFLTFVFSACTRASEPVPEHVRVIEEHLIAFSEKYSNPGGVSMAVSYNERLVYSGAIGFADSDQKIKLTDEHRMRIASLSKPVTAIAIMKLVEENRLSLDDYVFGEGGIFNNEYGTPIRSNRADTDVTVRHLLEHSSGGWGNTPNDPVFIHNTLSGSDLMTRVLQNFTILHEPGTFYNYSNFGYFVLGRIIEKITDMPYEDYVREHILAPIGIYGMRIGSDGPVPDEPEYIPSQWENPYSSIPAHMDSYGGWVANPLEFLRLLVHVDAFPHVPDLLEYETIRTMTAPSSVSDFYALGWSVNQRDNWWHTGALSGVSTIMVRASNGFNWVIMTNFRPVDTLRRQFVSDMDRLFWDVLGIVSGWPTGTEF